VTGEEGLRAFESNPSLVYRAAKVQKLPPGRNADLVVEGPAGVVVAGLGLRVLLFQTCVFFATHAMT
jgi:hypothetical protein